MEKIYQPIEWEDFPSEKTPISSENLGKMDLAINEIDSRVVEHEHNKLSKEESDNRYANAIKRTYSGETIVATDSSQAKFERLRVLGRSEQVSTTGKNLFDISTQNESSKNRYKVDENGWIDFSFNNSSGTSIQYPMYLTNPSELIEANKEYLIVCEIESISNCTLHPIDSSTDSYKGQFTTGLGYESTGTKISKIIARDSFEGCTSMLRGYTIVPAGKVASARFRISVIEDTTVTADTFVYEPYSGGYTSPSPNWEQPTESIGDDGSIKVGVYGRNAVKPTVTTLTQNGLTVTIDENGVITANGTLTANTSFIVGKYKLPLKCKLRLFMENRPLNTIYAITIDNEGNNQGAYSGSNWISGVFRGSETERNVQIVFIAATYTNFKAKIIVAADTDEWEPYKESQSLITSTPNGLPGIKVKKAEYATYKDKNGVMWVSDEIDFAKCKYVHRVKKVTPTLVGGGYHTNGNYYVVVNVDNKVYAIVASMCSKAINGRDTDFMYSDGYYYENSSNFVFNGTADDTLETMREKLNGMELLYILAEPIETELSTSEIEAYKALTSNYPTTTILNDENAHMEAVIVADTKNHIEQNYVPKSEFLSVVDRISALEQKALA